MVKNTYSCFVKCDRNNILKTQCQYVFICYREIAPNEEVLVYYSDNYFGANNADCLCQHCASKKSNAATVEEDVEQSVCDTGDTEASSSVGVDASDEVSVDNDNVFHSLTQ